MTVPVWLLDIDGVLNAVGPKTIYKGKWPRAEWLETELRTAHGGPFLIRIAKPVIDFIIVTHEHGLAEIRWHTTWQEEALKLADWAGLPPFPVHACPEYLGWRHRSTWWKLPAANRVSNVEGRRLLWTDDDIRYELRNDSPLHAPGNLILAPDDRYGLSPDDLAQISMFLERERVEEGERVSG